MVATAPDTKPKRGRPGLARSSSSPTWQTGTGNRARRPRAGHRPAPADDQASRRRDDVRRAAAAAAKAPAGLGRDELPGTCRGPPPRGGHLRGAPARVRHVDAARDRRAPQQDAPRAELHPRRGAGRRHDPVAAVRLARADRAAGTAVDDPARAGRCGRRDHAVELAVACWACASSRRHSPWAMPSSSSRIRRRRCAAAPIFAADLQGGRPARRPAPDRHRRRRDRRGARHGPQRQHGQLHRVDRGRADRRRQGRRPAQEGQPRAGRQQPADRAR